MSTPRHLRVEVDGVTLYVGTRDAVLAFPSLGTGLATAVDVAQESGVREIACWPLQPDDALGEQLTGLGFQDGWQPHWMVRSFIGLRGARLRPAARL